MIEPQVSVVCICHNCAHLLPMALASLRAQAFAGWECIVVDDGSRDDPAAVVEQLHDERVRLVRIAANRGRGYARWYAQSFLRGDLVAFLDADDWWYPRKLEHQVAYLSGHPNTVLVGTGLAIVEARGQLLGTARCTSLARGPEKVLVPRVGFATVCARRRLLEAHPFDAGYGVAEDREWLIRVIGGEQYANIGAPLYAYYADRSESLARYWRTSIANLRTFARHARRLPVQAFCQSALTVGKTAAYAAAAALGRPQWVARRGWRPATPEVAAEHACALQVVAEEKARLFGETARWPSWGTVPSAVGAEISSRAT